MPVSAIQQGTQGFFFFFLCAMNGVLGEVINFSDFSESLHRKIKSELINDYSKGVMGLLLWGLLWSLWPFTWTVLQLNQGCLQ